MKDSLIEDVAEALQVGGSVPLPGGHGTLFGAARRACSCYLAAPGVVERCIVALAIIGDDAGLNQDERRFTLKDWDLRVRDWFSQRRSPHSLPIAQVERSRYMIHAMHLLVRRWAGSDAGRLAVAQRTAAWRDRADARLVEVINTFSLWRPMPPFQIYPATADEDPNDERDPWAVASQELGGPTPEPALALLFMHLMHARLGILQPAPDEPLASRTGALFYARLLQLLKHSACRQMGGDLADRLANVISGTVQLQGTGAALRLQPLMSRLPRCFNVYEGGPAVRLLLADARVGYGEPAQRIGHARWLADIVADMVIDPVRVRPTPGAPGFDTSCYGWLCERALAGLLPVHFAAIRDGRVPALVQRGLSLVRADPWAKIAASGRPCALCHVEAA